MKLHLASHSGSTHTPLYKKLCAIIREADPHTHALVFDIDHTLLHSNRRLKSQRRNKPIVALYDQAVAAGYHVYLVTARPDTETNNLLTLQELQRDGITLFTGLYMLPAAKPSTLAAVGKYKSSARQQIMKHTGRRILLTVGDMWTDLRALSPAAVDKLDAKHGERKYLLVQKPSSGVAWGLKLPEIKS